MSNRKLSTGTWLLAMAAVAVVAGGTQAWADPIRFDNPAGPGHFDWYGGTAEVPIGLEVMVDAASQNGAFDDVPGEFQQTNSLASNDIVSGGTGTEMLEVGGYGDLFIVGVNEGVLIPSGLSWSSFGYIYHPSVGTELTPGVETYVGVEFTLGDGTHYGWIGVVPLWVSDAGGSGDDALGLDAFAWGYETEAGVPIEAGVPEPGTLALLAMGAVGVLSRRRHA